MPEHYAPLLADIAAVLDRARRKAVQAVNVTLTAAYWDSGRRLVEYEQGGTARAAYGQALLKRLSGDLTTRFGRGFSVDNLENMRLFYVAYPAAQISGTLSRKLPVTRKSETASRNLSAADLVTAFPLSWSHCLLLVKRARSVPMRDFYQDEAPHGGCSARSRESFGSWS